MPNFITDQTTLPYPKSDLRALKASENPLKHYTAAEWNSVCQAMIDTRDYLLNSGFVRTGATQVIADQGGIWAAPETPHAYDQEFSVGSGNALPTSWTLVSGSSTISATAPNPYDKFAGTEARVSLNTARRSWLMIQPPNGTTFRVGREVTVSTNFAIMAKFSYNFRSSQAPINNDFSVGLSLSMSGFDANNRIDVTLNESDAGVKQCEFAKIDGGASTSIATTADVPEGEVSPFAAVLLQKRGTTYDAWVITEAGHQAWLGTTTMTAAMGHVSISCSCADSTNNPGNLMLGCDWMRFREGIWVP